ncbi:peptidoglycan-binding domain-containing protein, partial [Gilliamella sp. CG35]|uniref:peptidoglycan-binding domain-containing protein n=1 Tax=Gilliamella sp. CG35 TaxID=3351507 RepID=UPI00398790C8
ESIKQGLEQQRRDYQRFPDGYEDAPEKKLTQEQLNLLGKINELEEKYKLWEKSKEKATKMLWWDDVTKGLAKQSQQTEQSDAETKKEQSADASSKQTQTSSTLATLSQNGRVWFIHPVSMVNYFSDNKVLFQKGDKDEIIREINIRLAGFGGNVPTDEFTERTENMIKQFQRDYMKVEETGVVDMQVIEAIDKFQEEYPIETYFAQAKCKCSTYKLEVEIKACGGFGLGRYSEQKQKEDPVEMLRQYEYPGLHRTLFWVLRAWKFYLKHFDQRNMKIEKVESGYRCWRDNKFHKDRQTTNHMGKALDIHMVYDNPKITKANLCDDAREVMIKYCDAQYRWAKPNFVSLEPGNRVKISTDKAVASTWVHYDVRSFQLVYLKDEYFAKSVEQANGISMQTLITNKG